MSYLEKLKQACIEATTPVGNMSDAPVLNAIKRGMKFHEATCPNGILEIITELESLREQSCGWKAVGWLMIHPSDTTQNELLLSDSVRHIEEPKGFKFQRVFTNAQTGISANVDDLVKSAQAVVDRWDSPAWKDQPHTAEFINALRNSIAKYEKN